MEIEILNTHKNDFSPVIGERTMELLSRFGQKLDEDGIDTLSSETIEILSHCTNPYKNEVQSVTNLVVGYVQSGKTMSFTTLSALAHDNGFRIIIYFAGTKNNLLSQTTKRLRKDLINGSANSAYYKLFENPTLEYAQRIRNALNISSKPTILITVLKHHKYISDLAAMFNSMQLKQTLGKAGVLIIDDEADQASLNGYAYKNSKSEEWEDDEYTTTYSSIMKLKGALANHSYIQYTATPQGPLLISIMDLLSPKHHTVLTPGKTYTGGKTFFCDEPGLIITIPEGEVFHSKHNNLADCPDSLVNALQLHLMGVAIIVKLLQKESFLSMMIHADRDQDASEKFYRWIKNIIDAWSNILANGEQDLGYQELKDSFAKCYPESIRMYEAHNESAPSFEDIWCCIDDIILDTNVELVISRNKRQGENKEIDWASSCSHILVGADMLNRGFTVEHLAVTYMPRCSVGKSTADTIQQRCRFFGYKQNYLWSCRVFLPFEVIIEYKEYVEHEEEMRKWLLDNKNLEDVERLLLISNRLNATRKNILSKHTVTTKLNGWRKMNAFQAIDENTTFVNRFLADVELKLFENYGTDDRNHGYVKLPIQRIIEFLTEFKFQNMPDAARKEATLRYIKYLSTKKQGALEYAYIIQMAYRGIPRERAFDIDTFRINNLHSGRSMSGSTVYPGDANIKFEDSICIQIHHVKLKCNSTQWAGRTAYTLAIYYPEEFAINYVETGSGLWAELFVISIASNPEYLLKAWHSSLNDVYDFNDGIDKIEVKSTSKSHRIHKFSYDQLSPTENTNLIISSIFVIQSGIGKNIFDLKEDIETQICSLELRYKLNEIIFRTLGSEFEKVYDVYFDYQQAVDSYKLIPAIYIPSLNSESIPNEITNIHFDCDLSQIDVPDNIAAIYPHSKLFSSL